MVRIWAVATAVATTWPESSSSSPARNATSRPRRTTRPRPVSRPGRAGRRNCTCRSVVGANRPGPSVATSAGPRVSSSIAARNPPWIAPTGFRNCSLAVNATSIVPASGSIATSSHPSRVAAGGGAARPSITSQNGPSRVTLSFLSGPGSCLMGTTPGLRDSGDAGTRTPNPGDGTLRWSESGGSIGSPDLCVTVAPRLTANLVLDPADNDMNARFHGVVRAGSG